MHLHFSIITPPDLLLFFFTVDPADLFYPARDFIFTLCTTVITSLKCHNICCQEHRFTYPLELMNVCMGVRTETKTLYLEQGIGLSVGGEVVDRKHSIRLSYFGCFSTTE